MAFVWNDYYNITKRVLLLSGQWPYQEKRTRLFRVSSVTLIIVSLIVPQVAQIFHCNGNARCIQLVIPLFMLMVIFLMKLYTCQFNSSKIKSLTDHLCDDWEKLNSAEEYEIMKKYATNAKFITLAYFLYLFLCFSIFILISLVPTLLNIVLPLNESRPATMPYHAYYFVDNEKYYFYIMFHIIASVTIALMTSLAHDCTLFIYIEHVCSLFAVTGFRLETLSRNNNDTVNNRPDDRKIYNQKIAASVHAHWRAIRFAEILEDLFCTAFAIHMLIYVVTLSISLLQVALQYGDISEMLKYLTYIFAQVLHTFCFSLQGQRLINHSMQLRDRIYNSSWYEIPVESQRLLLYVMRRSMEPCFLSAGKIYVFSLKSFTTVMQSSVSYFTVLASTQ